MTEREFIGGKLLKEVVDVARGIAVQQQWSKSKVLEQAILTYRKVLNNEMQTTANTNQQ